MDLMTGIAQMSMEKSAAALAQGYSTAVAKKVMDTMEQSAETLLADMMPAAEVSVPKGEYIDVSV